MRWRYQRLAGQELPPRSTDEITKTATSVGVALRSAGYVTGCRRRRQTQVLATSETVARE
jgi:hypothetical protein